MKLGIPVVAGGPVAIPAGAFGKRPHCIMRGICLLGCKVGAKSSIHLSHIPDAIAHGAEIRTRSMVCEIPIDADGRATGVRYFRTLPDGRIAEEEQRARAVGVLGEILPDERNHVSIHQTERDQFGIPVPYVHFNLFENDRRLMQSGVEKARAVLEAAGAVETHFVPRCAHLVGTCRMGSSPADSVVDRWCRSWDGPNLLVCDGSVLPTQGSANPALLISALAARTADGLRAAIPRGDLRTRPSSAGGGGI